MIRYRHKIVIARSCGTRLRLELRHSFQKKSRHTKAEGTGNWRGIKPEKGASNAIKPETALGGVVGKKIPQSKYCRSLGQRPKKSMANVLPERRPPGWLQLGPRARNDLEKVSFLNGGGVQRETFKDRKKTH